MADCTCPIPIIQKGYNVFLGKRYELRLCCLAKNTYPDALTVTDLAAELVEDWDEAEARKEAHQAAEIARVAAHNARVADFNDRLDPADRKKEAQRPQAMPETYARKDKPKFIKDRRP